MGQKSNPILPIFSVVFLDMIGVGIAIPVIAAIFFDPAHSVLPADYSQQLRGMLFGLLIAVYPLAQFFGAPILGGLSDHYGRKKLLLLSLAGTFIGYLMFGYGVLTANVPLMFLGRIVDGFTGGNISIAMSAIADISDEKAKVRNFGMVGMAFGLGFIIGPFLGGKMADNTLVGWFNYSTPFFAAALLSLLNILLLSFAFSETLGERAKTKLSVWMGIRNIRHAIDIPALRTIFLVVFLLTFGFSLYAQFVQVYLIEKFGYVESQIGDLFAWLGICVAVVQGLIVRPISKIRSPQEVLLFSVPMLALVIFAVLLPSEKYAIFLIVPFIALFQGLTLPNINTIVSDSGAKDSQGEILGINQSVQSLGQAIPPLLAGAVVGFNVNLPIMMSSAVLLAGALAFTFAYLPERKKVFHEV